MERWKTIKDWPSYEVSDRGAVRNRKTKQPPQQSTDSAGCLRAHLYADKAAGTSDQRPRFKRAGVHRLVAQAFVPNPHGKPRVWHKDLSKSNNRAGNLEWLTNEEYARHRRALSQAPVAISRVPIDGEKPSIVAFGPRAHVFAAETEGSPIGCYKRIQKEVRRVKPTVQERFGPSIEGPQCEYCGAPAEHRDHAIPRCFTGEDFRSKWLVWACRSCNTTLSDFITDTFEERCECVARRLRKKHCKLLATPRWTPENLKEASFKLRKPRLPHGQRPPGVSL